MSSYEVNFDGIVGPTHNYSGLSYGNVASMSHQSQVSNPKQAALQGLEKMHLLMQQGIKQAVLPPQERPDIAVLEKLGFSGSVNDILAAAYSLQPELLFACSSSSSMWAANAATVSPSIDSADHLVHFTAANLSNKFHRSIEATFTQNVLSVIFAHSEYFIHHHILPPGDAFSDEGAANHTRLCNDYSEPGIQLFVYGRNALKKTHGTTQLFPARQTYEASQAISRLHQLSPAHVVFAQQNPQAIDAGVFHNDVISVGNKNLFFYHEQAFVDTDKVINELKNKFKAATQKELILIPVKNTQVSLKDAVASFLFNSQIVSMPDQTMQMIAPTECQTIPSVNLFLKSLLAQSDQPIKKIHYMNLHESMRNGGGPACLRLRVVLNEKELDAMRQSVILTESLYKKLTTWVENHYRDSLTPKDLADPRLLFESRKALDELTQILQLGPIYSFQ